MPKTVYFPEDADRSGISITWYKRPQRLEISGWFDGGSGIESTSLTLREFFERLGITKEDCEKAWRD